MIIKKIPENIFFTLWLAIANSKGGSRMFWDKVAGVYDIYVNVINRKTHQELKRLVSGLIRNRIPMKNVRNKVKLPSTTFPARKAT